MKSSPMISLKTYNYKIDETRQKEHKCFKEICCSKSGNKLADQLSKTDSHPASPLGQTEKQGIQEMLRQAQVHKNQRQLLQFRYFLPNIRNHQSSVT